jgi:hypothetical protein
LASFAADLNVRRWRKNLASLRSLKGGAIMDNGAAQTSWFQRVQWQKATVLVAPAAALLIVLAVFLLVRKILTTPTWPDHTDLRIYHDAAGAILAGASPYDPSLFDSGPYGYPPLFADFIALLRLALGWGHSWLIWPLICAVCLFGALYLLMRKFGTRTPLSWIGVTGGLLMLGHIGRTDLFHGQPSFVLLLLFLTGLLYHRQGAILRGALAWGAIIAVKPFLGAVVFYLLRRGQWRAAIATVAASGGLFFLGFLPFVARLPDAIQGWLEASRWYSSIPNVARPANQTAYGLFTRLFIDTQYSNPWLDAPVLVPILMIPVLLIVVAGIYFGVSGRTTASSNDADNAECGARDLIEASLTLGLVMAMGPLAESPHLYLLLPAIFGSGIMLRLKWNTPQLRRSWATATGFWAALFIIFIIPYRAQLISTSQWAELTGVKILVSGLNGYIVLAACVFSAWALYSERSARPRIAQ